MKFARFSLRSNATRPRGFTLIELLTVIVIIGVLAAIMIPVLGKVRESAATATCVSNLKQIGTAIINFAADNKGQLPYNDQNRISDPRWYLLLNPYVGRQASDWTIPSVFYCRSTDANSGSAGQYKLWSDYGYRCNLALMPVLPKGDSATWNPARPVLLEAANANRILIADTGSIKRLYITENSVQIPYEGDVTRARAHRGGVNVLKTNFGVSWIKAEVIASEEGKKLTWY